MKFGDIAKILKRRRYIRLYDSADGQYIGDDISVYPIRGLPELDEEAVYTLLGVPEEKKSAWYLERLTAPRELIADKLSGDICVDPVGLRIWSGHSGYVVPLEVLGDRGSSPRVVYINAAYLDPLSKELGGYELYLRGAGTDSPHVVAMTGLTFLASFTPVTRLPEEMEGMLRLLYRGSDYQRAERDGDQVEWEEEE